MQIDYQYLNADDFYGNYGKVERENDCALIDREGTVLFTAQDCNNITYYVDAARWIINGKLYDYDMNQLEEIGNLSLINMKIYLLFFILMRKSLVL